MRAAAHPNTTDNRHCQDDWPQHYFITTSFLHKLQLAATWCNRHATSTDSAGGADCLGPGQSVANAEVLRRQQQWWPVWQRTPTSWQSSPSRYAMSLWLHFQTLSMITHHHDLWYHPINYNCTQYAVRVVSKSLQRWRSFSLELTVIWLLLGSACQLFQRNMLKTALSDIAYHEHYLSPPSCTSDSLVMYWRFRNEISLIDKSHTTHENLTTNRMILSIIQRWNVNLKLRSSENCRHA